MGDDDSDSGDDDDDELRDAWGLLLHRTEEVEDYVRVGIWLSTSRDGGGMKYFQDVGDTDVIIV